MVDPRGDGEYWTIDVPGLSKLQADALVEHAAASYGLHGLSSDPTRWYTRRMDRDTVAALMQALEGSRVHQEDEAVVGVLEDLHDWLRQCSET